MIGVEANKEDEGVVAEFFELFKTPWEFRQESRHYQVVLFLGDEPVVPIQQADLTIIYSNRIQEWAGARSDLEVQEQQGGVFRFGTSMLPIYGKSVSFPDEGGAVLPVSKQGRTLIARKSTGERSDIRVGYSLCDEVRKLLTEGQPEAFAACPTIETHIALLRDLIVASGIELIEIPPAPEGYRFIACLTHDVDHPSIVRHKWDRTAAGFTLRATIGSFIQFLRRRIGPGDLLRNWSAAAKLPLMYMGWAKDCWSGFGKRYEAAESGLPSTYFVIPFQGREGREIQGKAPRSRAAGYGVSDIAEEIHEIAGLGMEVNLHGIDAWIDSEAGQEERGEIGNVTGEMPIGIRMHWLYFGDKSPRTLENAGFDFDSTIGYRETCGFKSGTTQVFKPLNAERLLELPLHAMDTALFYPVYLNLTQEQASSRVTELVATLAQSGGCFTVNWHDRSLAPERNWNQCYMELLAELKRQGAWFATAGDAVAWFKMRREVRFDGNEIRRSAASDTQKADSMKHLPGLKVLVHPAQGSRHGQSAKTDDETLAVNRNARDLSQRGVAQ